MKGKSIYFTKRQLELISLVFDYGNSSFGDSDNVEQKEEDRAEILRKVREDTHGTSK